LGDAKLELERKGGDLLGKGDADEEAGALGGKFRVLHKKMRYGFLVWSDRDGCSGPKKVGGYQVLNAKRGLKKMGKMVWGPGKGRKKGW